MKSPGQSQGGVSRQMGCVPGYVIPPTMQKRDCGAKSMLPTKRERDGRRRSKAWDDDADGGGGGGGVGSLPTNLELL